MFDWLQQFPYRIELMLLIPICFVSAAVSMLIACLTVGGNAAKVAQASPIGALRHE
jgi:putative ABC transport system permease protein